MDINTPKSSLYTKRNPHSRECTTFFWIHIYKFSNVRYVAQPPHNFCFGLASLCLLVVAATVGVIGGGFFTTAAEKMDDNLVVANQEVAPSNMTDEHCIATVTLFV